MVSHASSQGGGVPALPNFLEFLSIYAYTLCCRTTDFDVVTHVGGCVSHDSHPKRAEFQRSPIFVYLFLHPLTQNDQIGHGNQYMGGACF